MTTWVTFAPSFLFVLTGAPWMERLRGNRKLAKALNAITAAVAGTILNLAIWFAVNVLFAETRTLSYGALEVLWPDVTSLDPILAGIALLAAFLVFLRQSAAWRRCWR
ncbi:chromate transporter [Roseibium salinum]|nr:chromate transporter [Roseibium salinum]